MGRRVRHARRSLRHQLAGQHCGRGAAGLRVGGMSPRPLDLPPDDFSALVAGVGEEAVRHLRRLDASPIRPASSGAETLELFSGPLPEAGLGAAALDDLRAVADHSRTGNGRFFGYVMGSGEPVAALGDLFASVINQNGTAWRSGPATAVIERTVAGWLAEAIGCAGFTGDPDEWRLAGEPDGAGHGARGTRPGQRGRRRRRCRLRLVRGAHVDRQGGRAAGARPGQPPADPGRRATCGWIPTPCAAPSRPTGPRAGCRWRSSPAPARS